MDILDLVVGALVVFRPWRHFLLLANAPFVGAEALAFLFHRLLLLLLLFLPLSVTGLLRLREFEKQDSSWQIKIILYYIERVCVYIVLS